MAVHFEGRFAATSQDDGDRSARLEAVLKWQESSFAVCRNRSRRATAMVAAVADVDIEIKDGSFVTLLGPSGCGKTTTLRLIAGYMAPDRGTIEVDGTVLSSPGAVVSPESRGMGMVFQNYAIWPHKNVFENVVFGLKIRKVPSAEAAPQGRGSAGAGQSLRASKAVIRANCPAASSSASRSRARLVVEPDILLLDEPLSNLDAKLRERMRTELKDLQRPHRHHLRLRHP